MDGDALPVLPLDVLTARRRLCSRLPVVIGCPSLSDSDSTSRSALRFRGFPAGKVLLAILPTAGPGRADLVRFGSGGAGLVDVGLAGAGLDVDFAGRDFVGAG